MGMSYSSSGRLGFDLKTLSKEECNQLLKDLKQLKNSRLKLNSSFEEGDEFPNSKFVEEFCIVLLKKENEYRLSAEFQEMYRQEVDKDPAYGYQTVTDYIQQRLADDLNIERSLCLRVLQHSQQLINNANDISFYRKYNRLVDGNLLIGNDAPQLFLHTLNGDNAPLIAHYQKRPSVLISGSYS
jgi:hypothetical protein